MPLHWASAEGLGVCVDALLEARADVNIVANAVRLTGFETDALLPLLCDRLSGLTTVVFAA